VMFAFGLVSVSRSHQCSLKTVVQKKIDEAANISKMQHEMLIVISVSADRCPYCGCSWFDFRQNMVTRRVTDCILKASANRTIDDLIHESRVLSLVSAWCHVGLACLEPIEADVCHAPLFDF
jgi:hypothetical protein